MRHGEVHNPARVLYGRLPGYGLSADGRRMARQAAEYVQSLERPVGRLVSSPLQRTSEPFTELFGLDPQIDERVIEPTNVFEGRRMKRALANPINWRHLRAPDLPSWGEPYLQIVARMDAAMRDTWEATESGDAVIVSHQLPIWVTHLAVTGALMRHNPTQRRCALSSITTFTLDDEGTWSEIAYVEPATLSGAVDVGAV